MGISSANLDHEVTGTDAYTATDHDGSSGLCVQLVCPPNSGGVIPLERGLTIGRGADCTARVDAGAVSRHHARFNEKCGLFYCVDQGSRNGTYVNGRLVSEAPVGPGDVVRCGDSVWLVRRNGSGVCTSGVRLLAPDLYGGDTMAEALEPLHRFAVSRFPVVLEGETGVGKELAARALHNWSGRTGKYVAVNCAALPEPLAEGELFGYRKGAFTGAERPHPGFFRAAQNGTLLLDEICELPLRLQAKLLRVIEQQEVVPLGESEPIALDVRILAAAQNSLRKEVSAGRFRGDLLTRLGVTVSLPPLRERLEDTLPLFLLFLEQTMPKLPNLQARFVESMLLYRFPKNVRELKQLAEWVATMCRDEPLLRRSHLPSWILQDVPLISGEPADSRDLGVDLQSVVSKRNPVVEPHRAQSDQDLPRLLSSLARHRGNVVRAAEAVGLSRHQAYRLLRSCPEVSLERFRQSSGTWNGARSTAGNGAHETEVIQ